MVAHATLLRRLNRLSKDIRATINNPNYGGCGFVAAAVGHELERAGLPTDIIVQLYEYGISPRDVRERLVLKGQSRAVCSNWDSNGLWRSHLAVRFESAGRVYHWDSEGVIRAEKGFTKENNHVTPKYPLGAGLTPHEVDDMNKSVAHWNRTFDRDQVPELHRIVKRHFSTLHWSTSPRKRVYCEAP